MRPTERSAAVRRALLLAWVFLLVAGPAAAQHRVTARVGDFLVLGILGAAGGSTLLLEDFDGTRELLTGGAVNALATVGLKKLVEKPRPDESDQQSFPSGHTSVAFQGASFIHFRYGLRYAIPAYAGAAFVGYSRVHARKHFVEDVLVGVAMGTLSAWLFTSERPEEGDRPLPRLHLGVTLGFGGGMPIRVGAGPVGSHP